VKSSGTRKRKCLNCGKMFIPDPRSKGRQRYCGEKECRKASHRASSRKYYRKKRKDPAWMAAQSQRVRNWQKENPRKAKRKKFKKSCKKNECLRDSERGAKRSERDDLRDDFIFYNTCLKGVIAQLTEAEPDNIVSRMNFYYDRGKELVSSS